MKLTVIYDPITGDVVPDEKVASYVKEHIVMAKNCSPSPKITIGSVLIIDEIRALISEGVIDHKNITFKYKLEKLNPDKTGMLSHWPKGFCDVYDNILERLLNRAYKK